MKAFTCLLIAALACLNGCGSEGVVGGPGADKTDAVAGVKSSEETFAVDVPLLATRLKQGEEKTISLGLKRGQNFQEDVTLSFEKLPKGITIEPAQAEIRASEAKTKITVTAAADAALGDFTIDVIGHPTKGKDAKNDLKITVVDK